MLKNKLSYFQGGGGVNEPTPKEEKYKSEKIDHIKTRFDEPFYKNYDLYDVKGKHGPGAGWHEMQNYKSVSDFLKEKRKKLKNKYKNKDKIKARAEHFYNIIKSAIDFPIDDQITPINDGEDSYPYAVGFGGLLDEYLPGNDLEEKRPDQLNFGRDYSDQNIDAVMSDLLHNKNFVEEPDLYGLPDGIEPEEDLDADKTINIENPESGKTDSGNTIYNKMWI